MGKVHSKNKHLASEALPHRHVPTAVINSSKKSVVSGSSSNKIRPSVTSVDERINTAIATEDEAGNRKNSISIMQNTPAYLTPDSIGNSLNRPASPHAPHTKSTDAPIQVMASDGQTIPMNITTHQPNATLAVPAVANTGHSATSLAESGPKNDLSADQITTFEAFGITIPSLVLDSSVSETSFTKMALKPPEPATVTIIADPEDKKEEKQDDSEEYKPPPPSANGRRRRWSVAEPPQRRWTVSDSNSQAVGAGTSQSINRRANQNGLPTIKRSVDNLVDNVIHMSGSVANMSSSQNLSKDQKPLARPKSILKQRSTVMIPAGSAEQSTTNDPKIIVDYGGDVIQHSSTTMPRPSIMSSLCKTNPADADTPEVRDKLRQELSLFEERIKQRMTPSIFLKGEFIIKKHDIGKEMFFLSKGNVEILSSDEKTQYGIIKAGSFFGELGVLFDIPRTASVRALENCYCMILTREHLHSSLRGFPILEQRFRAVVEARMQEVQEMRARGRRVQIMIPSDQ